MGDDDALTLTPPPIPLVPLPVGQPPRETPSRERAWVGNDVLELQRLEAEYDLIESDVEKCDKCERRHVQRNGQRSCKGHKAGFRDYPCHAAPAIGLEVCYAHGGSRTRATDKRKLAVAEAEARRSLAQVGLEPIGNPIDELAALAAEVVATKDHFADMVAMLGDQYRFTDDKGAEQLDARVALYERALERCQKVLSDLARIGFEEKRLQLDEARALLTFRFMQGVLGDLGHRVDDESVRAAIERWARVLDGEPSPERTVIELERLEYP